MSSAAARIQMTIRLNREDKAFLAEKTAAVGYEGSIAVRQIVELMVLRLRRGGDFIDALHELKTVWSVPAASQHTDSSATPEGDGQSEDGGQ